jgi:hypothetical protein
MPKLPSWLANTMEKVISNKIYQVEVVETKMLSSNLKCVTFKGDFFDAKFIPGMEVLFRVNATSTDIIPYLPLIKWMKPAKLSFI